jgi:hypothetical protein
MECDLYPAISFSRSRATIETTEESKARAKSNLDSARGTLEEQSTLKQKRIQRLQTSLTSKREIIQGCQDMMSESLRNSFFSGLGPRIQDDSVLSQRRKDQRRKRLSDRLVSIVGSTVATSFQAEFDDREPMRAKAEALEILECTAGWVNSASRNLIWFGAKIKNTSDQALYHIRLSVAQRNSRGRTVPRLASQGTDAIMGTIEVDGMSLDDSELLDRSKALSKILTNAVMLHYSPLAGQDNYGSLDSSAFLIPTFIRQDRPTDAWSSFIGNHT